MNRLTKRLGAISAAALLALATSVVSGPAAYASTIAIDLSGYPNFTTIDHVSIPGVTFIAANPAQVQVINGKLWILTAVSGVDLTIRVTDGTAFSAFYDGFGSCQIDGFDVLGLSLSSTPVNTFTTFNASGSGSGRCSSGTYSQTMPYDEFTVDVATSQGIQLSNMVLDAFVPSSSSATSDQTPPPIPQSVPVPRSGSCADVEDAEFAYGVKGLTGGWSQSWARWHNGGQGGPVCVRTLVYDNARSTWVVGP